MTRALFFVASLASASCSSTSSDVVTDVSFNAGAGGATAVADGAGGAALDSGAPGAGGAASGGATAGAGGAVAETGGSTGTGGAPEGTGGAPEYPDSTSACAGQSDCRDWIQKWEAIDPVAVVLPDTNDQQYTIHFTVRLTLASSAPRLRRASVRLFMSPFLGQDGVTGDLEYMDVHADSPQTLTVTGPDVIVYGPALPAMDYMKVIAGQSHLVNMCGQVSHVFFNGNGAAPACNACTISVERTCDATWKPAS